MQELYDTSTPKKAIDLSIKSDLLKRIRSININLFATLELALSEQLAKILRALKTRNY